MMRCQAEISSDSINNLNFPKRAVDVRFCRQFLRFQSAKKDGNATLLPKKF